MVNSISTFNFESHQLRTIPFNDVTWFIAKDICDALEITNPSEALKKLDDDEKMTVSLTDGQKRALGLTISLTDSQKGGAQMISAVNESGLYSLVLRSRKAVKQGTPQHRFRKWVTSEVLPSIRKTGQYQHLITSEEQHEITNAVHEIVYSMTERVISDRNNPNFKKLRSENYSKVWRSLYDRFKIPRYASLPRSQFNAAMAFLGGLNPSQKHIAQSQIEEIPQTIHEKLAQAMAELHKREDKVRRELSGAKLDEALEKIEGLRNRAEKAKWHLGEAGMNLAFFEGRLVGLDDLLNTSEKSFYLN